MNGKNKHKQPYYQRAYSWARSVYRKMSLYSLIKLNDRLRWHVFPKKRYGGCFVIFSYGRTGSTTLRYLINCHPCIRCAGEIFNCYNIARGAWGVYPAIKTETGRKECYIETPQQQRLVLDRVLMRYNGFKHLEDHFKEKTLNYLLLSDFNLKVIFLWRKNALQCKVSKALACQTGIWQTMRPSDYETHLGWQYLPIDIENLKRSIAYYKESVTAYRDHLVSHKADFFEVTYEELFGDKVTFDERLDLVNKIIMFLGHSAVKDKNAVQTMRKLFDANNKLNSAKTYLRIPNINEIKKELENDANGFLF